MKVSRVPPTEITFGEAEGYSAGVPLSPEETKKLTPDLGYGRLDLYQAVKSMKE